MLGHRTLNAEDYFAILKRRWWIVCIPAVILPVVAVISSYFLTPKYDSTSLILIDQQKVSTDIVKPLDIGGLQERLALITAQIESRSTLEPIITKYNLYASQHISMEARVAEFRDPTKGLQIAPIQSQIEGANGLPGFKVIFTADDPRTAQEVCADVTGLYTQNNLLNLQSMTTGTKEFLQTELNEETRKLDDMEQKLAEFKTKNMGSLPGDQSTTANFLSSLGSRLDATNQQIANLQQNRSMKEVQLNLAKSATVPAAVAVKTEQTDEAELTAAEANLATLQTQYTDEYPEVKAAKRRVADLQAQIAKAAAAPAPVVAPVARVDSPAVVELNTQIRLIDQDIAARTKEQAQIQAQMGSYEGRLNASPEVEAQYEKLTRDFQTETANYNNLQTKMGQSNMATEMEDRQEGEGFSVLDAASLPIDPTFPKQSVFAFGGLGGGLALGLLIVALLEYRDTAMRTERDIWAFTQLPTLAVIAYSDNVAQGLPPSSGFLKRIFHRKGPQEQLAG
jgi:polysaccharide chain length determinant protein (PEP-CTERM system associated)